MPESVRLRQPWLLPLIVVRMIGAPVTTNFAIIVGKAPFCTVTRGTLKLIA